eukprot:gene11355-15227_t
MKKGPRAKFGRGHRILSSSNIPIDQKDVKKGLVSDILNKIIGRFDTDKNVTLEVPVPSTDQQADIVIIGAGISGLACAKTLLEKRPNLKVHVVESMSNVGGRVQTDVVDGYRLDRGFQVFLTEYPKAKEIFDYKLLNLQYFLPGAIVRFNQSFHLVSDPLRCPKDIIPTAISPIGSFIDKIKIGLFSLSIRTDSIGTILSRDEYNTEEYLKEVQGLSDSMIDRFFKPFYQGIFLSPLSLQSSRMFEFVFKMFTEGAATLPQFGMQVIPDQLKQQLPSDTIILNTRVNNIKKYNRNKFVLELITKGNEKISTLFCNHVVVAADPISAKELLSSHFVTITQDNNNNKKNKIIETFIPEAKIEIPQARCSICLYFGFDGLPPVLDPILILNGENDMKSPKHVTTINNVCFPSQVSKEYAPVGKSLASVTVVTTEDLLTSNSDEILEAKVRNQLIEWWGTQIDSWSLLKIYRIPYAQPAQSPPCIVAGLPAVIDNDGVYCCGDYRNTPTLNGAIQSGIDSANKIINDIYKQ